MSDLLDEYKKLSDDKVKLLDIIGYMAIRYLPADDISSFVHCAYNGEYDVLYKYLGIEHKQN